MRASREDPGRHAKRVNQPERPRRLQTTVEIDLDPLWQCPHQFFALVHRLITDQYNVKAVLTQRVKIA